jgi:glyoxylase-like metal-dependent hydrolase (beta-lactamase superfamily II)
MIQEIAEKLYRVEIPLPGNPLKSINSYMIKSPGRNLIIDTGMNRTACREAMHKGLSELDIDLGRTDFFITHLHADHFGLVSGLVAENAKVYFNKPDADRIYASHWDEMLEAAGRHGFPQGILEMALQNHPGRKYGSDLTFELTLLEDGDTIEVGDYTLRCVQTPGHTRGHMCLYEPDRKLFFSGDHILIDITPNIQAWSDDDNPLKEYIESLQKVSAYDIALTLPGHRRTIEDTKQRIRELIDHHHHRADEVLAILQNGGQTAYQVASRMTWDIDSPTWEEFPIMQQWFATGEAIAHIRYLEEEGKVSRETQDGKIIIAPR